jgi:hypothetical protein
MRRIEARRKNAKAFRLRHSQSLAKRRQRLSQAMPIWLGTCSAAPVIDRSGTVQSMAPPPHSLFAAFKTRWRGAILVSIIQSRYAKFLKELTKRFRYRVAKIEGVFTAAIGLVARAIAL